MQLPSALLLAAMLVAADDKEQPHQPLFATIHLDRNESQEVQLAASNFFPASSR